MHASGSPKARHASSANPRCCGDNSSAIVQWGIHCSGEYNELQPAAKEENSAKIRACKAKRSEVTFGARKATGSGAGKRPNDPRETANEGVIVAIRSRKVLAAVISTESQARRVI